MWYETGCPCYCGAADLLSDTPLKAQFLKRREQPSVSKGLGACSLTRCPPLPSVVSPLRTTPPRVLEGPGSASSQAWAPHKSREPQFPHPLSGQFSLGRVVLHPFPTDGVFREAFVTDETVFLFCFLERHDPFGLERIPVTKT